MVDEKDRLGSKLHDVEKAREDQWAAQRDRELLEELRKRRAELQQAASQASHPVTALCPHCHQTLETRHHGKLTVLECTKGDGAWLDARQLSELLARLG